MGTGNYNDIAISVPSVEDLPDEDLPGTLSAQTHPANAPPVFFGHYWLIGDPLIGASARPRRVLASPTGAPGGATCCCIGWRGAVRV